MDFWKSFCIFGCDKRVDKNRQKSFESDYNNNKNMDHIKTSNKSVEPSLR